MPGGHLNIKILSYQSRDPHVKDKMVSQPSYLNIGIPIPGKDGLYIETGPSVLGVSLSNYICLTQDKATHLPPWWIQCCSSPKCFTHSKYFHIFFKSLNVPNVYHQSVIPYITYNNFFKFILGNIQIYLHFWNISMFCARFWYLQCLYVPMKISVLN